MSRAFIATIVGVLILALPALAHGPVDWIMRGQ